MVWVTWKGTTSFPKTVKLSYTNMSQYPRFKTLYLNPNLFAQTNFIHYGRLAQTVNVIQGEQGQSSDPCSRPLAQLPSIQKKCYASSCIFCLNPKEKSFAAYPLSFSTKILSKIGKRNYIMK